tara:strand:- start:16816 stop:17556 length:741 start_codon:yes stop_codon:yes gene_type:complete
MFEYFNNEALRKLVIGFGSLFDDILVKMGDGTKLRVPLSYGPKEKFIQRIRELSSISDEVRLQTTMPRLAFELLGLTYDPTRKANKLRKTTSQGSGRFSYSEVPYIASFGLYTFTRNINENLQVLEQILPYFQPEFVITLNINDVNKKVDIPIVLNGLSVTEDYEGGFDTRRSVNTVFQFSAKTYVYGPIKTKPVITEANANMFRILGNTGFGGDGFTSESISVVGSTGTTGSDGSITRNDWFDNE